MSGLEATQGIRQLAAAGVLVPLGGGAENRSWEARGLLDLIAGLDDAGLPGRR